MRRKLESAQHHDDDLTSFVRLASRRLQRCHKSEQHILDLGLVELADG